MEGLARAVCKACAWGKRVHPCAQIPKGDALTIMTILSILRSCHLMQPSRDDCGETLKAHQKEGTTSFPELAEPSTSESASLSSAELPLNAHMLHAHEIANNLESLPLVLDSNFDR